MTDFEVELKVLLAEEYYSNSRGLVDREDWYRRRYSATLHGLIRHRPNSALK